MKKTNIKKGFTLIELLAVIVILAIIALIATPIIINVIEGARKKAFENSVYGIMETYKLKTIGEEELVGKIYNFPEGNNELKYSGNKMIGGSIFLTPGKDIEVRELTDGRYCADGNKGNLVVKKGKCEPDLTTMPVIRKSQVSPWGIPFLNTGISRDDIESMEFVMVAEFPSGAIDVSEKGNGTVKLWTKDENGNNLQEVYIGAINDVVYANPDSSYLFACISFAEKINLSNFDTSTATNMNSMFEATGYGVSDFTLNLGDKFDTSEVTNMYNMFSHSLGLQRLDLGNKFDTSKVTNMEQMFQWTGYNNSNFTLDLGNKFDTSNVTIMNSMFDGIGAGSTNFTLNLGNKFDTRNVLYMGTMFQMAGYYGTNFTLNLGDKFDTRNVTYMAGMFSGSGYSNPNFTLNLGDKFDTSKVTYMGEIFSDVGRLNPNFTLDLGGKFNVDSVTYFDGEFSGTGASNPLFKPTATVKTQAEKNAILAKFPNIDVTIKP